MWITRDELSTFLLMTTITITKIDLDLRKNGQRLPGKVNFLMPNPQCPMPTLDLNGLPFPPREKPEREESNGSL